MVRESSSRPARTVYLDGHATTPLCHEADAAMAPLWAESAGNPQSPHGRGQRAARLVEDARADVARLIGAAPSEVVFTSGATESNNLILFGIAEAALDRADPRRTLVVSAVEHKSVSAPAHALASRGFDVRIAPVTPDGRVSIPDLQELLDETVLLVSVMAANNETGVVQPLAEVAALARAAGALMHSDMAQMAGKMPVDMLELDLDYASLSAHKMYGPMGIGAAFVSASAPIRPAPRTFGGGQEAGLRAGTLPLPLIAGFGAAASRALRDGAGDALRQAALAESLLDQLERRQVRVRQNAAASPRLPGSLSVQLPQVAAEELIPRLADRVFLSDGSACSRGQILTSHVLEAMNFNKDESRRTIRLYIDKNIREDDVIFAADQIAVELCAAALAAGGNVQ